MAASMVRWSVFRNNLPCFPRAYNVRQCQVLAASKDAVEEESYYPEVKPKFPTGGWGSMDPKIAWLWDDFRRNIAEIRTVKGKLDHFAERKVRTWKYNVVDTTPDILDYQCDVTKSALQLDTLPSVYSDIDVDQLVEIAKPVILETILQEHETNRSKLIRKTSVAETLTPGLVHNVVDHEISRIVFRNLLSNVLSVLSIKGKDLLACHMDYNVTVSASWYRNGVLRNKPRVKPKSPSYIRQNNAPFHGTHVVDFQFRKPQPLPEFLSPDDSLCSSLSYKRMLDYSPKVLGQFQETFERSVTAGFNPGDPCPFNHLSVILSTGHQLKKIGYKYGEQYQQQAELGYVMSTGFLSTAAQAFMQGFNYFEELTYPFTTQTILTDGQHFMFSAYQLNTLLLWKDDAANKLQNVCWVKNSGKLYEKCEEGKVVGFNDDVLKMLLKFLVIPSSDRNGIDLSPNINKDIEAQMVDIPDRQIIEVIEKPVVYDRN